MPSHHGVGLDEHERRPPIPPRLGEDDPKQPISPPESRTADRAFQRVKLLAEREVLEDQFVMSATGQRQRAEEYKGHLQHMSIVAFPPGTEQPTPRSVLIVAKDSVIHGQGLFLVNAITGIDLRLNRSTPPSSVSHP